MADTVGLESSISLGLRVFLPPLLPGSLRPESGGIDEDTPFRTKCSKVLFLLFAHFTYRLYGSTSVRAIALVELLLT